MEAEEEAGVIVFDYVPVLGAVDGGDVCVVDPGCENGGFIEQHGEDLWLRKRWESVYFVMRLTSAIVGWNR
jgi:hypothetical protein